MKHKSQSNWQPLFPSKNGKHIGLLKFCPDLTLTPDTKTKCLDNKDKITKRFVSEEGRINDTDRMIELYRLRDFVYNHRSHHFHWDLAKSLEFIGRLDHAVDAQVDQHVSDAQPVVQVDSDEIQPVQHTETSTHGDGGKKQMEGVLLLQRRSLMTLGHMSLLQLMVTTNHR